MLVETDNLVSAEEFRDNLEKFAVAARCGVGPIAVAKGTEVLGFFIGPSDYEAMLGQSVRNLLKQRSSGPTVSHEEVKTRIRGLIRKRQKS